MDGICLVCGCKTEEIDFVEFESGFGGTLSVCGYCGRQLQALKAADENDSEQLSKIQSKVRWLDAVIEKEVEDRSGEYEKALIKLRERFPSMPSQSSASPVLQKSRGYGVGAGVSREQGETDAQASKKLQELEKRLEKLENSFSRLKRRILFTSIAEIVIPAILMMILAMIFFKSDLWVNLSRLIYSATGGYTMF
ncbi:MAG: hypothetical protein BWY46_00298 [Firmicutes bacterium ADurb.Bin300]|jgi:DNA repair exonuclease SbcCD ATPase subunit|nr:MAG: hypothetical protein BWY46_00298 [Firmicutes bacterium ADurb.Bin300]